MTPTSRQAALVAADSFVPRHIGPRGSDVTEMLATVGYPSLDAFIDAVIPDNIRFKRSLAIHAERSEHQALTTLREIASKNQVFRSYIGMGYADCITLR